MHANRGGVEDGVEKRGAQSRAGHSLSTESAREFPCGFFAGRADSDGRARAYQCKSGCPRSTTRSVDQDAAAFDADFFLKRAEHAEVIGVAAIERAVAANKDRINGANFHGQRIALLQVLKNRLLVRMGDAEPADSQFGNGSQKIANLMHKKWEIDSIHSAGRETSVMQQRRKRMADGI